MTCWGLDRGRSADVTQAGRSHFASHLSALRSSLQHNSLSCNNTGLWEHPILRGHILWDEMLCHRLVAPDILNFKGL